MKRVLIYGKGEMYQKYGDYLNSVFEVVGVYDKNTILELSYLRDEDYNAIIVTSSKYYDEIYNDLIQCGINSNKIGLVDKLIDYNDFSTFKLKQMAGKESLEYKDWCEMYQIVLEAMNIGMGECVETSGEKYVLDYIRGKMDIKCVFDVGANIGSYTLKIKKQLGNVEVHAFEASKKTFGVLKENTKDEKNVILVNKAVSDQEGLATLFSDKENSGLASLFDRQLGALNIDFSLREKVELTTLDTYCKENGIDRIDFLKMDIEGNEYKALIGAKAMLSQGRIGAIQIEFGGCNIDSKTFIRDFWYLLNEKYDMYRILQNSIEKIDKYDEKLEIFVTTNFLFLRK